MISGRIITITVLIAAAAIAAFAAYGRDSGQETSFDSNLAEFMKRTDSSLLKIARLQGQQVGEGAKQIDEYSLAASNPTLYQYIASVDKAHDRGAGIGTEPQQASLQVIISSSQTRTILQEIGPKMQQNPDQSLYDIYAESIELSGRQYEVAIMIPK